MSQQQCFKHKQAITFICTVQNCKQNRKICDVCKAKQTLHFSHHANYIYKIKQFFQFKNSKVVLPRLQKGIHDAQIFIGNHKQFYSSQIQRINEDFAQLSKSFEEVTLQYKNIYISNFQKEIKAFDQDLMTIIANMKTYANQKNQQQSFFSKLFTSDKNQFDVEEIVTRNALAFKIRSDIINIRSKLATSKTNKNFYKNSTMQEQKFKEMNQYLKQFLATFYDKLKVFINPQNINTSESTSLKSSIVSDSKQLTLSRVSSLTSLDINGLKKSRSFQNKMKSSQMLSPHPKVIQVIKYLKPLPNFAQWNNLKYEGPYKYEAGTYQGSFQNGLRSGKGIFVFNDGSYYQGGWQNDQISGYGRFVKQNSYYQGDIKQGKANGKGNYQDIQKTYSGSWKNDKRQGIGEEQFKNAKRKYTGNFVDDKYQGKGKFVDEQYIYEGDFKNGLFDGEGIIKYRSGQIFVGSFKQNYRVYGRHSFTNGSFYQGTFRANMPDGKGDFFWPDGIKYSGQWRQGVQEGEGIQTQSNGKQIRGIWQKGNWVRWL